MLHWTKSGKQWIHTFRAKDDKLDIFKVSLKVFFAFCSASAMILFTNLLPPNIRSSGKKASHSLIPLALMQMPPCDR